MKVCPKCNTEFEDNMGFCLADGTVLEDSSGSSSEKTLVLDDLPTKVQNKKTQQAGLTQKKSNNQKTMGDKIRQRNEFWLNNPLAIIASVLSFVLFFVIVYFGWFYLFSKNKPASSSNKTPVAEKNLAEVFAKAPPGGSPTWSQGSPSALVTVEEFADFQCPTCAQMHPKVKELRAALGDRVRIIFRQFPLTIHPFGYDAACAAEAAGLQGKFWEMQNIIFTNQQAWANSNDARRLFTDYAKTLGLNVEKFSDDMIGLQVKNKVDADIQRGRALNVESTPSFYINGKPLGGRDLDGLRSVVEAELQKVEAAKQTQTAPANSNTSSNSNTATNK